jgi:hypothetical protein
MTTHAFPCSIIAGGAAIFLSALTFPALAQVAFEADFNGAGTGTGGSSNVVTLGGTATVYSGGDADASVSTAAPVLFPGETGYLKIETTGSGTAGINITSTASHSPDSWFTLQSGSMTFDTVNGGTDFFFTSSVDSSDWTGGNEFRPLDISGGTSGLRAILNAVGANQLQFDFFGENSAGTHVQTAMATATVHLVAGQLYHLAYTLSTNSSSGVITANLYLAPGNTPINTATGAYLIATATTAGAIVGTGTNAVTHAFNSSSGYWFGAGYSNGPLAKTLEFGAFRVYNKVPANFGDEEYLPNLTVATPGANPTLPSTFDLYSPPVTSSAPAANTPAMAEWTRTGIPGDGLVISGNGFSTNTSTAFGKDTSFEAFGESGAALLLTQTEIRHLSTNGNSSAAIALDPGLPANSMYLVWPKNSNGAGTPMAVNQTEAWWLGPNIASSSSACFAAGQPISVYGRNLYLTGTTPVVPMIWIQQSGASSGTWVTPTAYNPYKLDFTIPASLSNGSSYQVWVHNGHGGAYGWSLCPQTLVLTAPIAWTGSTFNVTSYGATGNGTTDDTTAIRNAMNAAGAAATSTVGTTLSFPAGTYIITSGLVTVANVKWVGASTSTTILRGGPTANGLYMIEVPNTAPNTWVTNMTLDAGVAPNSNHQSMLISNTGTTANPGAGQSTRFINVAFSGTSNAIQSMAYFAANNLFFENCVFTGDGSTLFNGGQVFVDHTTYNVMNDTVVWNVKGGLNGFSMTNNIAQNKGTWASATSTNTVATTTTSNTLTVASATGFVVGDTVAGNGLPSPETITAVSGNVVTLSADPTTAEGTGNNYTAFNPTNVGIGIFIKGLNDGGARNNFYYGNNQTIGLGDENIYETWGEQMSFEEDYGQYYGTPTSSSASSMTFNPSTMSPEGFTTTGMSLMATIVNGTGLGQSRNVASYSLTSGVVTLTTPWNLPPDSTSTVVLGFYLKDIAIYDNQLQGQAADCTPNNSSTNSHGVLVYGGVFDLSAEGNTFDHLAGGFAEYPLSQRAETPSPLHFCPNFFHVVQNNTMTNCANGITEFAPGFPSGVPATYGFAHVFRHNTISNSTLSGFYSLMSAQASGPPSSDMVLFDTTTVTGCPLGVYLHDAPPGYPADNAGAYIFTGNSFTLGGATAPGYGLPYNIALDATDTTNLELSDNTYSGWATQYGSTTVPGGVLEEPYRTYSEAASLNGTASVTDNLIFTDAGTAAITGTLSSDSSWLTISPTSGTVPNESTVGTVSMTCNATGLADGTYIGTITGTSGSQSKSIEVTFTVSGSVTPEEEMTPEPNLISAASVQNHAGTPYALDLPLSGDGAVEDRVTNGTVQLVFTFDQPMTSGMAQVTDGDQNLSCSTACSGNTLTVTVTGVTDMEELTVNLSQLNGTSATAELGVGLLEGDVDRNGAVNSQDLVAVRNALGGQSGVAGFKPAADIDENGAVNSQDLIQVRNNLGNGLP